MNQYNELFKDIKPVTSNDAFTYEVMRKHRKRRRSNKRAVILTICITTVLIASTLTAGAVGNWDYPVIFSNFFNGTPFSGEPEVLIAEQTGGHEEINFSIGQNTFEGITFEVTGLYAEPNALIVFLDVISAEPIFNKGSRGSYNTINPNPGEDQFLFNNTTGHWDIGHTRFSNTFVKSENVLTVVYRIDDMNDIITEGTGYTIMFYGINEYTGVVYNEPVNDPVTGPGIAEIKFGIDKLALNSLIVIYPDVSLENGNVIKELRISPFSIWVMFSGDDEENLRQEWNHFLTLLLRMKDGSLAGTNSNASAGRFYACEKTYEIMRYVSFDSPINVNNIAAIVYRDVEIPLP